MNVKQMTKKENAACLKAMSLEINTVDDAKELFRILIKDLKLAFHPDDDLLDYVYFNPGKRGHDKRVFTLNQGAYLNKQVDTACYVLDKANVCRYGVCIEIDPIV